MVTTLPSGILWLRQFLIRASSRRLLQDLNAFCMNSWRFAGSQRHYQGAKVGAKESDGVLTGRADGQKRGGKGVGFRGGRQDNGGEVGVLGRMASAGVDDVAEGFARAGE